MELTVTVHHEHGSYWSEIAELPGCFASGRTLAELGAALAEAVGLYVADRPGALGPEPLRPGVSTISVTVS